VKNIVHFLYKSKLAILGILCLLVVQAYCDLALPSYTSDLLNVGLQQGGIESPVMNQVQADSLDTLELFMTDDTAADVDRCYSAPDENGIRTLSQDADEAYLSDALTIPECIVYQLSQSQDTSGSLEDIRAAISSGMMTKEQLQAQMSQAMGEMEGLTDTYLNQIAVYYVSAEYEAQGQDLDQIRNDYLWGIGGKMLVMAAVMTIASVLTGLLASVTSAKVGRGLRQAIYERVMRFTNAEMEQFSTASLITRSTNDIQQVQMVIVMLLRMVAYAPILAIGGIIKVVQTATGMSWIIVLAVIILAACVGILMAIAMPKFKKMQVLVDRLNLVSRELLTGIMPIRAFSREKHEEARFEQANQNLYQTQLFTNRTMTFMQPVMMFVMNGISVLIVWVGAHGVDNGTIQVGDMTAFITYSMVIVMGFLMIAMISIMLPRAGVAADRIVEVIETPISLEDPQTPKDESLSDPKGVVEFHNVSFTYPGAEEPVISQISFTAKPGETTAIIGSTGCGKSTLLNLIPRFYDVTEGSITLDGIDLRDLSQHKLHALLGYVPQKGILFSGTIQSNLKYSGESVSDEAMIQAAEIAQATEFISSKPEGYQTPISQGGSNVSGGQKQRLSIARAIAKHPKVFLFDDSFSALDYKTDLALRKALAEQTGDATVIIVAQRISTILHADQILVLDNGRIVGKGTHQELLRSCETYQEIAKSQLSDTELAAAEKGGEA
jgi:ATP-binding cassette subfamily B protein